MRILSVAICALLVASPAFAWDTPEPAPTPPPAAGPISSHASATSHAKAASKSSSTVTNSNGGQAAANPPALGLAIAGNCTGSGFGVGAAGIGGGASMQMVRLDPDCVNLRNIDAVTRSRSFPEALRDRLATQMVLHLGQDRVFSVAEAHTEMCAAPTERERKFCP